MVKYILLFIYCIKKGNKALAYCQLYQYLATKKEFYHQDPARVTNVIYRKTE